MPTKGFSQGKMPFCSLVRTETKERAWPVAPADRAQFVLEGQAYGTAPALPSQAFTHPLSQVLQATPAKQLTADPPKTPRSFPSWGTRAL